MTEGKVISKEMMETEMGDRGSKSELIINWFCKRATSGCFFVYLGYI